MKTARIRLAVLALLALGAAPLQGQKDGVSALLTVPLAGQVVPVMPFTLVAGDGLPEGTLPADRAARALWADSLLAEVLLDRAPEINWMLPDTLRRIARRNTPMVGDPDRMGTSILRGSKIKKIPDPLRSSLRSLAAVAGGRIVFVPASLTFTMTESGQIRALLTAVMADVRSNSIVWRTAAPGVGDTATEALRIALSTILPLEPELE